MKFDISKLVWLNKPKKFDISEKKIIIVTEPETDFWQQTYYGFSHDNAHAAVQPIDKDFTFLLKADFNTKKLFDQCGVAIYMDSENWFKAAVEYGNKKYSQLGSVVTSMGYSDWATTDISSDIKRIWYRLSRRGKDFLIENSFNGKDFKQMRIFHMHIPTNTIKVGLFACSPLMSSFTVVFTNMKLTDCLWKEH